MKPLCFNFDVNAISDLRKRKLSARQATPHTTIDFSGAVDFNGNSRSLSQLSITDVNGHFRSAPLDILFRPSSIMDRVGVCFPIDFILHGDVRQLRLDCTRTIPRIVFVEAVLK